MRRQSKDEIPRLKRKLWDVFSRYVKERDGYKCFTCGVPCRGWNAQAGHFIRKSIGGIALYFHPDNVHCQCDRCNIDLDGNIPSYKEKLGPAMVMKLESLKNAAPRKWDKSNFEERIGYYTNLLSTVQANADIVY